MACFHGMPGWCALCNGTTLRRDDGHPHARPDDEPRFAKGRDSAKWVGIGETIKLDPDSRMRAANVHSARFLPGGFSAWSREQEQAFARDIEKRLAKRRQVVEPVQVSAPTRVVKVGGRLFVV